MAIYLEDLTPGLAVTANLITVTAEESIAFARQFDPQPFHTDPIAAAGTAFGGLVLSGWHTAALTMRMQATTPLADIANGMIGLEVRSLRFPRPVRPGDTLQLTAEVLETRPSRSRPGWGTAVIRWTTRNQRNESVLEAENVIWVQKRPA
jgi:acyl dehydratase